MNDNSIQERLRLATPKGAQIHFLSVTYNPGCKWIEALDGTDKTKQNYTELLKVEDQFPPGEPKNINETIVLIRYFRCGSLHVARTWAEPHGLQKTTPREVFAVGKQYPRLNADLGQELTCVVATKVFKFQGYSGACFCWRTCDELRMGVGFLTDFDTDEHWYSFVIPSSIV
jgi:hypothetical protein